MFLIIMLAALTDAGAVSVFRLRSGDGVDHLVNASRAVAHSPVLKYLADDVGQVDGIPIAMVASAELGRIVHFINAIRVDEVDRAIQWCEETLCTTSMDELYRLLSAADFLNLRLMTIAMASAECTWGSISAMENLLTDDTLPLIMGVARLSQIAATNEQDAIVSQVRHALVGQGNISVVNVAHWNPSRPLMNVAARHGETRIIETLLMTPGIDVNVADQDQATPLYEAAIHGYADIVELLLNAPGIDPNAPDRYGVTPLYAVVLVATGGVDTIALLDDADVTDGYVVPGPDAAALDGITRVVKLLLGAPGIDVNAPDAFGMTPLHVAAEAGSAFVVELLLQAPGIDVHVRDSFGMTALQRAADLGRGGHVVPLLLSVTGNATGIDVNALR
ncbi:hypothetical protein PBRA_008880 [Plasmodiophora brassicae]|uniref:Uncharacterized protein n=1 Tax=Plasmodiophora brassicae TaxID=37360 RepID=A0A0G4J4U4_PLABS|nr:hypothetical protein PBRA_008880 [Plasmodiophora brassicae]